MMSMICDLFLVFWLSDLLQVKINEDRIHVCKKEMQPFSYWVRVYLLPSRAMVMSQKRNGRHQMERGVSKCRLLNMTWLLYDSAHSNWVEMHKI